MRIRGEALFSRCRMLDLEITHTKRIGMARGREHRRPSIAICLCCVPYGVIICTAGASHRVEWRVPALARWIRPAEANCVLTSRDDTDAKTPSWRGPPHRVRSPSGAAIGQTPRARERSACVAYPWQPRQYRPALYRYRPSNPRPTPVRMLDKSGAWWCRSQRAKREYCLPSL